jgi:hypothetical protein
MKRAFISTIFCVLAILSAAAQNYSFSDRAQQYTFSDENNKKVVTGFVSFSKSDQTIFANALLWAIENISPKERDNLKDINFTTNSFSGNLVLASEEDSKLKNTYYCKLKIKVNEGRLVFHISDISIESTVLIAKKVTSVEKLQPEKKSSHQDIIDDFVRLESKVLNGLFDYVDTYKLNKISHMEEIKIGKPVKGMNEDECKLAFGKPQAVLESNGEVQWMYSSSFYLFFRNGIISSYIK